MTKKCSKCGGMKPVEMFYRMQKSRDGHASWCKECAKASASGWYAANKEKALARAAADYVNNPEKYRMKNATYRAANLEKMKANMKAWQLANPEKVKANNAAWYAANREKAKAYSAAYRAVNPDKVKLTLAAWAAANPEKIHASNAKRRALISHAPIVERIYRAKVFCRDEWICHLCGNPIDQQSKSPDPMSASIDHIVPLSKGGDHSYANIAAAHRGCNSRKKDRTK